ncbi:MAG: glycosyltransferase family 2 protein [Chitinophagaceae bacterium]
MGINKISIIIISYNRPDDALELLQNITSLQHTNQLLQEVILINNNSSVSYKTVENYITRHPAFPFKYVPSPENLGVSRGRNLGISLATAPILFFLDDDALLNDTDALQKVIAAFSSPPQNRPTGILSFRVLYHENHQWQINAFPHKQFQARKDLKTFETYYYVGCAHAIKKEVFEKAGPLPIDFFYGMEEYDLSYRTIEAGFSIQYNAGVTVLHKESPNGRQPKPEKLKGMWVNKSKVAWRYLPKRYFYSTAGMWGLLFLIKTGFNLRLFLSGLKEIISIKSDETRTPITENALQYIRSTKARLWY